MSKKSNKKLKAKFSYGAQLIPPFMTLEEIFLRQTFHRRTEMERRDWAIYIEVISSEIRSAMLSSSDT